MTQLKNLKEKEGQEQSRTVCRFEQCRIWDPISVTFDFILHSWYPGIPLKTWAFPGLHTSSRTIRPTLWWRTCWIFVLVPWPWHRIDTQISALCIFLEFLISQTFLSFLDWSIPFPFQMVSVCFGNIKFLGVKFCFQPFTSKQPNPLGEKSFVAKVCLHFSFLVTTLPTGTLIRSEAQSVKSLAKHLASEHRQAWQMLVWIWPTGFAASPMQRLRLPSTVGH